MENIAEGLPKIRYNIAEFSFVRVNVHQRNMAIDSEKLTTPYLIYRTLFRL